MVYPNNMKRSFTLSILLLIFTGVCFGQYSIHGKVMDEHSQPLPSVSVSIGKSRPITITDSLGNFSFSNSSAYLSLSFSHVGYDPVNIVIKAEQVPAVFMLRTNYFLAETVVSSFERNSNISNIPAAVTVLNKEALERYGSSSFVPAMNTVAGVKMDERSPGSYRLSIRGNLLRSTFGVRNVKIYWNGIPFTDANGNTYINELAFNNIGKIEILKGPSGSLYGAGTGGVVLLTNGLSTAKEKSFTLQTTAGSYGLFAANASYDQSGKNSVTSLSFSHQQTDGYRKHTKTHGVMWPILPELILSAANKI